MEKTGALRRALWLECFTIAWNLAEAGIAAGLGLYYKSNALVAFGLDSMIETAAAGVVTWRLLSEYRGKVVSEEHLESIERRTSLFVGLTFFLLAGYVLYESAEALLSGERAHPGTWGIVLAALSSAAMPVLWRLKVGAARDAGSDAMRHEAAETIICAYLSFILLAGLALNRFFGLWWADSAAALIMLYFIVKEGMEAVGEARGKRCGCSCRCG